MLDSTPRRQQPMRALPILGRLRSGLLPAWSARRRHGATRRAQESDAGMVSSPDAVRVPPDAGMMQPADPGPALLNPGWIGGPCLATVIVDMRTVDVY